MTRAEGSRVPTSHPSRLPLLALGFAALGCASGGPQASVSVGSTASGAQRATQFAARAQTADQQVHHVLNHLAFGARPGDTEAVRTMGVDAWVDRQLAPNCIADVATERFLARFSVLGKIGEQLLTDD